MSAQSESITAARFAAAITELPLFSLFAKGSEIRNSIAHLGLSNHELKGFAESGDKDCADAISENEQVIRRMRTRLELLKAEVEGRGFKWDEDTTVATNGNAAELQADDALPPQEGDMITEPSSVGSRQVQQTSVDARGTEDASRNGGRYGDEELRRLIAERMPQDDNDSEDDADGLHI